MSIGHRAQNVEGADIVIYSAAIAPDNPERARANELGIPQMERATLLGQLMEGYRHAINVCGTHGKTTTTSMIAEALVDAGVDPTVHIGGQLDYIGGSTRVGGHETFVVEACEFHESFLQFHPTIAVVTNIEEDHLDYYKDLDDIFRAFVRFCRLLPQDGACIGNGDDPRVRDLLALQPCRTVTYGLGRPASGVRRILLMTARDALPLILPLKGHAWRIPRCVFRENSMSCMRWPPWRPVCR